MPKGSRKNALHSESRTNTGNDGALTGNFLPLHAYTETAEALAARWIDEWKKWY